MCGAAVLNDVLHSPQRCDHAAHLYVDAESLFEAVDAFAGTGLDRGEAIILIARDAHLRAFTQRLGDAGHDCGALFESGQLQCIDADDCLAQIMAGRRPDRANFERIIREVIERAHGRFAGLRAYGEPVDILWKKRNRAAADALEHWWNELIEEYGFTLLCGYGADIFDFDEEVQAGIDEICRTHSHVMPVRDEERLERAFEAALTTVFHNGDAATLREHLIRRRKRKAHMPPAQVAMLGLRDILPSLAQEVRMVARAHYVASGERAPVPADAGI